MKNSVKKSVKFLWNVELFLHVFLHLYGGEKTGMLKFLSCTPIDKTIQKNFYKIKFSYLCTPIYKTTQKNFYKIKFSFLCMDTPTRACVLVSNWFSKSMSPYLCCQIALVIPWVHSCGVKYWWALCASAAFGVKCPFIHYLRQKMKISQKFFKTGMKVA